MNQEKYRKIAWLVIAILNLIPVFLWLLIMPLTDRFNDLNSALISVGQLSALIGTVLFSITLIIIIRIKFLEKIWHGLGAIYIDHHWLGGLSLILLLVHPLVLAISYLALSWEAAMLFLLPSGSFAKNTGIFALLLMTIILYFTFFNRPKYAFWKKMHGFLGLAFFLAGTHVFLLLATFLGIFL